MSARAITAGVCFFAATLATTAAFGQPASEQSLLDRGVHLRERGDDAGALETFTAAWNLSSSARARAQMALAEQALGRWVLAEEHLRDALTHRHESWIRHNLASLNAALAVIEDHLGDLDVRCETPGATLWIADAQVATLPLTSPRRMPLGAVSFEVRAAGFETERRTAVIAARSLSRESVEMHPTPPEAPPTPVTPPVAPVVPVVVPVTPPPRQVVQIETRSGGEWRIVGVGLVGLSAAGGALGVVSLLRRNDAAQQYNADSGCLGSDAPNMNLACTNRLSAVNGYETLAWVGLAGAGASAVLGTLAIVLGGPRVARTVVATVQPVGREGWMLGLGGRF